MPNTLVPYSAKINYTFKWIHVMHYYHQRTLTQKTSESRRLDLHIGAFGLQMEFVDNNKQY